MRLVRSRLPRPRVPATPLASLSILVLGCIFVSGLFSAARGPGLRFATFDEAGGFSKERAIRVELGGDGAVFLDGAPVKAGGLGEAVAARLSARSGAGVVLIVAPDVPYRTMLAAYGAISALPESPRVALPPRAWVEAAARARGHSQAQ